MKRSFALLILIAAVAAAYAPVVKDGFVWDDTALILRDPLIRSWRLIPEGFNYFLFVDATASDFYRPIQRLSYTLEYAAFAFKPMAYHVTSVLVHASAAVALFLFAESLLGVFAFSIRQRIGISLAASLVWAIHPVHNAAVAYVSGRADPLAAVFGFLGCYLLLRSNDCDKRGPLYWLSIASTVALLLSALSKESGLIFSVLALVLSIWTKGSKGLIRVFVMVLFVATAYFSLRSAAEHTPVPTLTTSSPSTRPIAMARAVAEYAGLILFPVNLHMDRDVNAQPQPSVDSSIDVFAWRELQTLLGILIMVAIAVWAYRARTREPATFCFLLLALIAYLPVSGMIPLNSSVAEHWIYLPTAFLFLAIATQTHSLVSRGILRLSVRRGLTIGLICWLIFLGGRTALRTQDWRDQRTFLEQTLAAGGDSSRMWINLGGLELSEGHLDKAKAALQRALQKEPEQPLAILNLAIVATREKDFQTARRLARRASEMPWVEAQAYELLAVIDFQEKGTANPLRLRLASRTGPPNWEIEKRYVRLMDELGATEAAIRELQGSLRTQWYRAESWELLGHLLRKTGHDSLAAIAEEEALSYDVHLTEHPARL